ncbi:SGT1 protein-domain-containing protein [Podospora appendiculata]|uniref:SGT1 protein-domain-containing protein n=1 Tax=Podospora appendiculata TaxID=314037 RepID=A0AAE0XC85_9PEZI|nr:SGT1 protein-domain-containing protein [Podospora appendiculata]
MNSPPAVELRPGDKGFDGFRMTLPENCVEYMLFLIGDQGLPRLEAVRKAAAKQLDEFTKDYIWQRDSFKLETKVEDGLCYLHGTTDYGDNVEDEWLIVYLLRELSRSFPDLWIRVFDSDGEFLLIEAAKVLPSWLSPEMDSNRVWIHEGKLRIIPVITTSSSEAKSTTAAAASKSISLREALKVLKATPDLPVHSTFIEAEAFYRLEKYPEQIASSLHHALVTIPRKLAYIIHARPKSIAPATEAFYLRDPAAMKHLLSSIPSTKCPLLFPPTPSNLVTISVLFTKVLYAQLKSQHFDPPPPAWRPLLQPAEITAASAPADSVAAHTLARLELGMKVTTGFELLARNAHESKNRIAREVALLLDDLAEDGEEEALPTDDEIKDWKEVEREDDDSWMNIDFEEFERELNGQGRAKAGAGAGTEAGQAFGDAKAQADLQKMVSRFEAFLNDETAGIDGAEVDEMDQDDDDEDEDDDDEEMDSEDEDRQVSFDEEQFTKMMREMMGLPPGAEDAEGTSTRQKTATGGSRSAKHNSPSSDEEEEMTEEEEEEIRTLMLQMEKELKGHGALDLDPSSKKGKKSQPLIKAEGRDRPAPDTSASKKGKEKEVEHDEDDDDDSDDEDDAVDIDYNLAKNLLESFKSQAGMAGPAGNLLSMMGMALPRDDGGEDEDGEEKGRR